MFFGIITLLITILSLIGLIKSLKSKNFFAVGYASIAVAVFGWFSIMTLKFALFPDADAAVTFILNLI